MAQSVDAGPTVLIVDDHPIIRRGLRELLVESFPGLVVREAATGAQLREAIGREPCHLVLLDISLKDEDGLDLVEAIREAAPDVPVLIFSMHSADQFIGRALRAGAAGYVVKGSSDIEIVHAVRKVLAGGKHFSAATLERIAMHLHPDRGGDPHERLSKREAQVLRMLATGETSSQIAEALGLSVKTVSTYRSRLLQKMGMETNAQLMRYAITHHLIE